MTFVGSAPLMNAVISKHRRLVSQFRIYLVNGSTDLAVTALGFASGILVARGLGPEGRGQLAAAMMWTTLAATLVCLGLQHAVGYATAAGWCSPQGLKRFARQYALFVGVPMAGVFALACPYLFARAFPGETWKPMLFGVSIPIAIYASFLMPIYQGQGEFSRWNRSKLIRSGGWTFAVSLLLFGGLATVLNLLIAQVAILFLFGSYLAAGVSGAPRAEDQPIPLPRLFRYGGAVYLSGIAYMVNQQLDQLLLSLWVDPAQLGQYAAAVTASGILLTASGAIGPIVFSRIARARESPRLQREVMTEGLWLSCSILLPSAVLLALLAPTIVSVLYGPAFAEAGLLLRILSPAAAFMGIGEVLATILRATGKPMLGTYGILAGVLVTVPGLMYALPRYGIFGAAWVSFGAYATMALCQGLLVWNHVKSNRPALETGTS